MVLRTTSFVVLLLACPAFAAAATCLVNAQGTGDYPNIGAAMAAAEDGDVIELADGVYTGTGNRDLDFEGKAIVIRSQSADPTACVIDCDGSPGDPHRAFEFMLGEDETSVVEGLTIRGGFAWKGGGLIAYNASPGIVNCIFEDNGADQEGGGIYGYLCGSSISGCTFARNTSPSGGGIYLYQCFGMQISSGTFSGNAATSGSALYCQSSSPTIAHTICVFGTDGEAIGGDQGANPVLTCCDVYGNAGGDWVGRIADQAGINGNFSADPLACAPEDGDFSLGSDSPCAAANNPGCGLIGAWPVGCGAADVPDPDLPHRGLTLRECRPNPGRVPITIRFAYATGGPLGVGIFDAAGRRVRSFILPGGAEGTGEITWDGADERGRRLPAGAYLIRLQRGSISVTRRLLFLP